MIGRDKNRGFIKTFETKTSLFRAGIQSRFRELDQGVLLDKRLKM